MRTPTTLRLFCAQLYSIYATKLHCLHLWCCSGISISRSAFPDNPGLSDRILVRYSPSSKPRLHPAEIPFTFVSFVGMNVFYLSINKYVLTKIAPVTLYGWLWIWRTISGRRRHKFTEGPERHIAGQSSKTCQKHQHHERRNQKFACGPRAPVGHVRVYDQKHATVRYLEQPRKLVFAREKCPAIKPRKHAHLHKSRSYPCSDKWRGQNCAKQAPFKCNCKQAWVVFRPEN